MPSDNPPRNQALVPLPEQVHKYLTPHVYLRQDKNQKYGLGASPY